ncbi:MAG TPA: HlyD family secretion protein [Croceibacterium sp.]|nr:HlyD family secretion protein [Croceibacterium sp.]
MARFTRRKLIGVLLCLAAAGVLVGGWTWAHSGSASTDNAYVRGDITSLAAKVGGYVTSVEVRDNQPVKAGDVLFRIDDSDYRARLARAEADVAAARAKAATVAAEIRLQHTLVRQARAQRGAALADLGLARTTSDRRLELVNSGAVSQALVDESQAGRIRAEAGASVSATAIDAQRQRAEVLVVEREAALAAVTQAEAVRDLARIDLEHTVVRAPISGVVGNRQVRVGRLVASGTPLLDIVPVADLFVIANFKETQLENIRPGQRANVRVDGFPDLVFEGVVDSIAPGSGSVFSLLPSDNATGNFVRVVQRVPIKIRLTQKPLPARLVPGLSATVELDDRRPS